MNKHTVDTFPLARIDSNVYENSPNIIQHPHTIARVELSGSSNDEFYEASPVYFPTLLDETNYPFVAVTTKPHMTQPLQECELNLEGVATINFHAFPFGNDTRTADELALTKIIQHEMCHPYRQSWWSPPNPWSDYIDHTPPLPTSFTQPDVYLDQVFSEIYLS